MQILIQVVAAPSTQSIRSFINNDHEELKHYRLKVRTTKKLGREDGWTKLHSTTSGVLGAINIEWDGATKMLICRVTTRSDEMPDEIIGDFIQYLFACHGEAIESINIIPRRKS